MRTAITISDSSQPKLMYKETVPFSSWGFADADWVGDVSDHRSMTGYCFTAGSAAISWCSEK